MNVRPIQSELSFRRRRLRLLLNIVLAITGTSAAATLVLEYGGFRELKEHYGHLLHFVQMAVVVLFVLDRVLRLVLAERRRRYLRENWLDFSLIAVLLVAMMVVSRLRGRFLSAGALYVAITHIYILVTLILHGLSVNLQLAGSGIHPMWMLIGSFALMCLAGSGLLMLPAARAQDSAVLYYGDALFTAVSATCVTGLVVRNTGADFSPFGQGVILAMIQLGGLGIMLFGTMLAMLVGKGLSVRGSDAMEQMMGSGGIGTLTRALRFVVLVTMGIELLGALAMYPMFRGALDAHGRALSQAGAVWHSIFHSVSSFCNAGFALYGDNMMQGVRRSGWQQPLRDHWQILGVMAPLIVLGGLGFPVLQDLAGYVRKGIRRLRKGLHLRHTEESSTAPRPRLSLHSKIVLGASALLIVLGMLVLLAVEPSRGRDKTSGAGRHGIRREHGDFTGDWAGMAGTRRAREALFHSISARTAGFNTVDMGELSNAGKLWMCGLMTVGGSPASTAGGMKTVTVSLLIVAAYCVLRRRNDVEAFQRSISSLVIRRTVTLAVLYLLLLATVTLLLCVSMRGRDFIDLLFEACSACGTVGLSTGVTGDLTVAGKCVIIVGMFAGRLGPLTLLLALTAGIRHVRYAYPEENVVIG